MKSLKMGDTKTRQAVVPLEGLKLGKQQEEGQKNMSWATGDLASRTTDQSYMGP